ncbi:MAG: hypothetical protein IJX47_02340 [Clostridia bacterium]|nr:hypothetical protein [Clostridia bacterium]
MIKFITFIVLTALSVAMLFAGFVLVGVPNGGGWNHIPLAGAMIGGGIIGVIVFGMLTGCAGDDLPNWRW